MADNVHRLPPRRRFRVAKATPFQRVQGIVADLEALGGTPEPDDLRMLAGRLDLLAADIERGEA